MARWSKVHVLSSLPRSPTHCLKLLPFSVPVTSTPANVPSASKQDQINPEEPNVNSKKNSCLENEAHYT